MTAILLLTIGIAAWVVPRWWKPRQPTVAGAAQIRSIAVLPFENLSATSEQDYFADGFTDELTTELARSTPLRVTSRTSAMHYKASRASLPQIALELGVDAIVEGSVVRQGDEVRITAQLIRASNDTHVWAKTYQRTTRDLMSLQAEVAAGIAENVTTALTGTPDGYLRRTPSLEAYEAYIKARASKVELTGSSLRQALALYQRAIDIDSQYAATYTGMAETYDALGTVGMMPAGEAVRLTREYAQKAVALEDSEAEAHATLGELAMMDWNWEAA